MHDERRSDTEGEDVIPPLAQHQRASGVSVVIPVALVLFDADLIRVPGVTTRGRARREPHLLMVKADNRPLVNQVARCVQAVNGISWHRPPGVVLAATRGG